ncbi:MULTISPECIES: hypothetical protein [unclassified Mesorhizobium]|uniref:hypothetical protein n=1 Tax=unclassified Mesorhizobium TaxID=325217 RepID=UPI000BB07F7E|nr:MULTISPECIES: hypothetical protein [unclassified Mesorhizobium]PBB25769.1 hypothetical protein CK232_15805 [Mesorhizobium sp. WSM4304]PBB73514.1 hypothetical protein CK227_21410 [Mesorhizobium sp. WSM4308]
MQITTIANSLPPAREIPAQTSTASPGPSAESKRISDDVAQARHTAMSALTNDRFSAMLEQITDPASSGALMTMRGDNAVDFKSAQSSYADNSE